MSLLNDMLRDLSQRQPVLDGAEGYDEQLLQASSIAPKKSQPWVGLSIFFILVFVGVLGVSYASKHIFTKNYLSEGALLHGDETLNTKENSGLEPKATPVATTQAATPSENPVLLNHIGDLLKQAERAMAMDRLTTPVEDNAYAYYQKILSMNAENLDAKEGLDKIAERYLLKAQEQSQLGNLSQAEALLQRARFVSARYVDAHTVEFSEITSQATNLAATQELIETPVNAQPTETVKPYVVAEASPVIKENAVVAKDAASVSVVPNAGWKDEQLVRHAQDLLQKGKEEEAKTLLKNFVASEQRPALSAALLAELYVQQANVAAANIILEQTDYLSVDVKAKLKAQILSLQGDDAQAITVLETHLSAADANEGYRSLLASLYHKTANYPQSILSYQRLINAFGDKPAYWLGLALAYDGLSQPKSALQAYLHLREFPQLQDQVKQYTDQRIAALRSQ